MADPGALSMFGPVVKPVGGHVLAHASTTRVSGQARSFSNKLVHSHTSWFTHTTYR